MRSVVQHPRRSHRSAALAAALMAIALLATGLSPADAKTSYKSFRPAKSPGRVCIHSGGKDLRYSKLDVKEPLQFTLSGPTRLQILSRHLPGVGDTGEKSYTLRVVRDGKEVLSKRISARASTSARVCADVGHAVGASRRSFLTVPKGKHVYQVYVEDEGPPVAVRLYKQVKAVKKAALIPYSPEAYDRICTLVTSTGHEFPHYHFRSESPLRFQIHGPTRLTVYIRPDFDQTMLASTSFGVEVLRNGVSTRAYHFDNVAKLSTASFKEEECREILPGERRKLTIQVPAGTWTYELRPTESGHGSLAARILIPKKDIATG